ERRMSNRFGVYRPAGGFFLWLDVGDGEAVCRRLWTEGGLRVLPGAYLSGGDPATSPGRPYIRVALVDEAATVDQALARLCAVLDP
ncbi:MAG: aspartate aminotransferase, partial [Geminicoccaceae bacterium]